MIKDCMYYHKKFIEKKNDELEGCSERYKIENVTFPAFSHLSVYFPDAYAHMLKVWGILDENS